MQVVYERCCGLDVHKRSVVACVVLTSADGSVQREVPTFGTMTADLLALNDWLNGLRVEQVALESTGVYWRPVYNLLEADHHLLLVNPQHMKTVPGRKTDGKDAEWLADLLRHGLLHASFIPPQPVRDLRELVRYRATLVRARADEVNRVRARADEVNRVQKVLESANVKLAAVATDVLGVSGRAMLEALVGGQQDPDALAELARGRLRAKLPELRAALEGRVRPIHVVQLRVLLAHIAFLETALDELQAEMERLLGPFAQAVELAETIPGIQQTAAVALIAEIGTEMSWFPSHRHRASWAGVCPGNKQSGGKRLSGKTTHGNPWLRRILAQVAWAISHTKDNYLSAQFHHIARRRGKQRAVVAVSHSVLVILYHLLRDQQPYHDRGAGYLDQLDRAHVERRYVHRLEQLGYTVTLTPKEAA